MKLLHEAFASDEDRLGSLRGKAQVLASLNFIARFRMLSDG